MEVFSKANNLSELPLGGSSTPNSELVQIRDIDGLGPVKSTIATIPNAVNRGDFYIGSVLPKRNIVLTLGLRPDWEDNTISSLRQLLYLYFMTGEWVKLRFYSDDFPTVEIEGYTESFEPNIFSKDPEVQISVICPQPDFVDADVTEILGSVNLGDPTEIEYIGTVPTGIHVRVTSSAETPVFDGILGGMLSLDEFTWTPLFEDEILIDGDQWFEMSTVLGNRYISSVNYYTLAHTSLLGSFDPVNWHQLVPGTNLFSIFASSPEPGQDWLLSYYNRFGAL